MRPSVCRASAWRRLRRRSCQDERPMSAVPGTPNRELRSSDIEAVREQLGRDPTTPFTVVARCSGGHPLVIRNAPRDAAGAPFPTTYWLTCPEAVRAVARLEAAGAIARFNEQERSDP